MCPTVREADGLAMSSRNTYLNPEQRQGAPVLYKALTLAQELFAKGERDSGVIRRKMTELIEREPLANIDYICIADARDAERDTPHQDPGPGVYGGEIRQDEID